jgi:hypothetical protein
VTVSGADICNHPALVTALAYALAARRKPPHMSPKRSERRPRGDDLRNTSADWLWDAKLELVDGARLAVHDDKGVLCELAATVGAWGWRRWLRI